MAIKDWRKTKENGWSNDKTFEKLRIWNVTGNYEVIIYGDDWESVEEKTFKTKSQALKFAREYMVSH